MNWDYEEKNLKMTRPAFGGHLMATIICPRFRPCMATVRPGVMKKSAFDPEKAKQVTITRIIPELTKEDIKAEVVEEMCIRDSCQTGQGACGQEDSL